MLHGAVLGNHDYYGNVLAQLDTHLVNRDPRWSCRRSAMFGKLLCPSSDGIRNAREPQDGDGGCHKHHCSFNMSSVAVAVASAVAPSFS